MFLSWLHNFFQKFRKDDEEQIDEIELNSTSSENHFYNVKKDNKELETRITYQYPKGKFRFPIIPDDHTIKPQERKPIRQGNPTPKQGNPIPEVEKKDKKELKEIKNHPQVKKKPQPKVRNSGPFKPTEIPSPIFGFQRPKNNDKAIEHELSHFSSQNDTDLHVKEQPVETNIQIGNRLKETEDVAGNEAIGNLSIQSMASSNEIRKPAEMAAINETIRKENEVDERLEKERHPYTATDENGGKMEDVGASEPSETEHFETVYDVDAADPSIDSNWDEVETDQPNLNEESIDPSVEASDRSAVLDQLEEVGQPPIHAHVETVENLGESDFQTMDSEVAEKESAVAVEMIDQEEVAPESADRESEFSNTSEADGNSANELGEVQIEEKKRSRQHLPFNVMMLKSDKQKWEERKRNTPFQRVLSEAERAEKENSQATAAGLQENGNDQLIHPDDDSSLASKGDHPYTDQPEKFAAEPKVNKEAVEQVEDSHFQFPDFDLLNPPIAENMDFEWVETQENLLNQTLQNFNVGAKVVNVTQGPSVTRFEVQPEPGVKVNKVTNLTDDIKLSLAAKDIRIEAPIPGKHTIGIEVPNQKSRPVFISEIIKSEVFTQSASPLTAVLGLDISGKPIVTDLKKMPHGLIAGATGSGKSVCINSILVSLLYKASPDDLKLLLIDPKMVELAPYNRIPHLVSPVITDVKAATAALKWAVDEMERRYELFAHTGVRDINRFNELAVQHKRYAEKLPFIVIIIDELADLMMMSPADVEEAICRIAQKARACGIHLIIATQRPSVDVITGLIKANVPTRIAFSVSSQVDSRTIIDIGGAEKLLGRGDMLFLENGSSKPVRLQGTFVSDEEIDTVVAHVREQREPEYLFEQEELLKKAQITEEEDELFYEACEFVVDQKAASTSSLQRRFKIGYNRAARLMDLMEQEGFISGANGSKPREVYINQSDLESILEAN